MKKTLLVLLSVIGLAGTSFAQSFTTQKDTVVAGYVGGAQEIHNNITAVGSTLYITWSVIAHNFPASWTDSASLGICDASVCVQNAGGQITNGTYFTGIVPYAAGTPGDFHMLLSLKNTAATGTYYMTVNLKASTTKGGASVYDKNIVFVVTKYTTGVKTVAKGDDAVSIYPNPAREMLNVNYNGSGNVKTISIFNVIGKNVQNNRATGNTTAVNIDNLPSGIYYARILDGNGAILATRRFTHE